MVTALVTVSKVRISGGEPEVRTSSAKLSGTRTRVRTYGAYQPAYFVAFHSARVREICA